MKKWTISLKPPLITMVELQILNTYNNKKVFMKKKNPNTIIIIIIIIIFIIIVVIIINFFIITIVYQLPQVPTRFEVL